MRNKAWTGPEVKKLAELYNEGMEIKDIAEVLGRTPKSVSGRVNKYRKEMGLGYRRKNPEKMRPKNIGKNKPQPDLKAKAKSLWAMAMGVFK